MSDVVNGARSIDEVVADHVHLTTFGDLPGTTVAATKRLILDTVGAAMAGVRADGCREVAALVERWGGAAEARTIGSQRRVPAHNAALVNATLARALEIDDVHERGLVHATASVVPVALASIDARPGPTGAELVTAVAIGIDLAARVGISLDVETPWGMSGTYQHSLFGAAATGAKLRGFDAGGIRNTIGVAYSQCAGNNQCILEGSLTVRVQQGLSASNAVVAADLHEVGVTGTLDSFGGRYGYFQAFHRGEAQPSRLTDGLGECWEVEEVSIKPFPCAKFTHTGVAAALDARAGGDFRAEDIDRVVTYVDEWVFDMTCRPVDPQERRQRLEDERGMVHAQFHLPYLTAVALVHGHVRLENLTDAGRADAQVLRVLDRVEGVVDPAAGRERPLPGRVEVHVVGHPEPFIGHARHPKGHPRNPMSFEEIAAKFLSVTDHVSDLFPDRERVVDVVASLEHAPDAGVLLEAIAS